MTDGDKKRIIVYVDGFNLYHAIDDLSKPHLKWVNLRRLCEEFMDTSVAKIEDVKYFSALAHHYPDRVHRHEKYLTFLKAADVTAVMGHFKEKHRKCPKCRHSWMGHEEKETDVNIAIHMLKDAVQGNLDIAYLISGDSDLVPAVKMVMKLAPSVMVKVISPPGRYHSKEMAKLVGNKRLSKIKEIHLERNLLSTRMIFDDKVIHMPIAYAKPST